MCKHLFNFFYLNLNYSYTLWKLHYSNCLKTRMFGVGHMWGVNEMCGVGHMWIEWWLLFWKGGFCITFLYRELAYLWQYCQGIPIVLGWWQAVDGLRPSADIGIMTKPILTHFVDVILKNRFLKNIFHHFWIFKNNKI